jgi:O-antigen ligase
VLIALVYVLGVIVSSWYRPMWGLALAANAFLVNAIIGAMDGLSFVIVGVGGPLLCFITLLVKRFLQKSSFFTPVGIEGYIVILLFFSFLLSALYSKDSIASLEIAIRYVFFVASFFFAVRFVVFNSTHPEVALHDFLMATMVIGVIVSIYALSQGQSASEYVMRLTIGNISPIPFSILIGQSFLISLFMLLVSTEWKSKVIYFLATLILCYAEILTNTRSTLIGIVLALLFFIAMSYRYFGNTIYIKLMMAAFLFVPLLITSMAGSEELYQRTFAGFGRIFSGEFGESEGDRMAAWLKALELFSDNLFLGIGSGNFGQYYIAYPHNALLEVLSENGIVGFGLLASLFAMGLFALSKLTSKYQLLLGSLFVYTLFISQVSLTLWMHKALFIWLAILTIAARDDIRNNNV